MNFAVFCSGFGSNLQAIIKAVNKGKIKANLALVLSDSKDCFALKRARRAKIKTAFVDLLLFKSRQEFDSELLRVLTAEKIDFIVLAGFMRIISAALISRFPQRILNIHPALLPSFKGTHSIKEAFDYGVKITGVTVHFVDEKMDHGAIILQSPVKVKESDTVESVEAKIHKLEHKLYPQAIRLLVEGKLRVEGRRARVV